MKIGEALEQLKTARGEAAIYFPGDPPQSLVARVARAVAARDGERPDMLPHPYGCKLGECERSCAAGHCSCAGCPEHCDDQAERLVVTWAEDWAADSLLPWEDDTRTEFYDERPTG